MVIDYRPRRRHYQGRKVRGLTRPSYNSGNPGDVGSQAEYGLDLTQLNSTIAATDAWVGTRLAFRFLILTATRYGEVRSAAWDEMDVDAALWTIPATRMKAVEHRAPLSGAALAVLDEARAIADPSGLVFPSVTGRPMSDSTLSKLLRENGMAAVPHGFRSSFRDWAAECTPFARGDGGGVGAPHIRRR